MMASESTGPIDDKPKVSCFGRPDTILTETVVLKIEDYDSMEALCLGSAPLESCERCDVKRKCTDYEPYWAEEARLTDPTTRYSLPFKVGVAYWKDESYRDESGLATVVQTDASVLDENFKKSFDGCKVIFSVRANFDCPERRGTRIFNGDHTKGMFGAQSENLKTRDWKAEMKMAIPKDMVGRLEIHVVVQALIYKESSAKFVRETPKGKGGGGYPVDSSTYETISLSEHEHLCDLNVIVASTGKAIRCHKLHLSRRSPVFHAMFKNRMAESESGEVTIPDFSEQAVEMMISFMYSGELLKGDNKEDVLQELLEISDKYEVDALKSRCESILVGEIGDLNVAALWVISDRFQAPKLKSEVFRYLSDNWERRSSLVDLEKVLTNHPGLITDLLPRLTIR